MNFLKGRISCSNGRSFFEEEGGSIRVETADWAQLSAQAGRAVTLGIRPEHCLIGEPGEFEASVEMVESMGAETYVYLHTGASQIISRSQTALERSVIGQRQRLRMQPERIHLFDPETGNLITRTREANYGGTEMQLSRAASSAAAGGVAVRS